MGGVRAQSSAQVDREACKLSSSPQAHREVCELYAGQANWEVSPLISMAAHLLASSPLMAPKPQFNSLFKYKRLIANVLVRTPVCKPIASPGSQGKNVSSRISASLQHKRLFCMTRVRPRTNNWERFAYLSFWVCCHFSNRKD